TKRSSTAGCSPEMSATSMRKATSRSPIVSKICSSTADSTSIPPKSKTHSCDTRPSQKSPSSACPTPDLAKSVAHSSSFTTAQRSPKKHSTLGHESGWPTIKFPDVISSAKNFPETPPVKSPNLPCVNGLSKTSHLI